jgi:starch phosphorylase
VKKLYWPAREQRRKLQANGAELARDLSQWKQRVRHAWPGVSLQLMLQPPAHLYHDEEIVLRVRANLNGLQAADVKLECLLGRVVTGGEFEVKQLAEIPATGVDGDFTEFAIDLAPEIAGMQVYKLRMYPVNEAMSHPFELGCMIWV